MLRNCGLWTGLCIPGTISSFFTYFDLQSHFDARDITAENGAIWKQLLKFYSDIYLFYVHCIELFILKQLKTH